MDGNRQKKRVRQPHSTAERHRKKALNDGEYLMEDGGGGRAKYSVHFNLPESVEYGKAHSQGFIFFTSIQSGYRYLYLYGTIFFLEIRYRKFYLSFFFRRRDARRL